MRGGNYCWSYDVDRNFSRQIQVCTAKSLLYIEADFRGIFGTCNQFGVVLGMLLAWVVGLPQLAIESDLNSQAFVLGLPLVFGVIQLVLLPFCPDSPAYLSEKDADLAEKAAEFYGLEVPEKTQNESSTPFCKCIIATSQYVLL